MAKKSLQEYEANPSLYDETSLNTLKAGRICAIIGTSISGAATLFFLFYMMIFGAYFAMILSLFGKVS